MFLSGVCLRTLLWILLQTYKEVLFVGKPWQRVFMNMMIFLCFSRKIWWMISSYYWYWKETSIHVKNHHMVGVDFNKKPSYPTFMVTSRNQDIFLNMALPVAWTRLTCCQWGPLSAVSFPQVVWSPLSDQ